MKLTNEQLEQVAQNDNGAYDYSVRVAFDDFAITLSLVDMAREILELRKRLEEYLSRGVVFDAVTKFGENVKVIISKEGGQK